MLLCVSALAFPAVGETVSVTTQQGRNVTVSTISPDIIRVENFAPGQSPSATLATSPKISEAGCTSMTAGPVQIFTTSTGVTVRIDSSTGAVDINAGANRAVSDNGVRSIADGKQSLSLSTLGGGSFYGAGERGYNFNLAGDTLVMYNKQNYGYTAGDPRIKQMNITMPLFLSLKRLCHCI